MHGLNSSINETGCGGFGPPQIYAKPRFPASINETQKNNELTVRRGSGNRSETDLNLSETDLRAGSGKSFQLQFNFAGVSTKPGKRPPIQHEFNVRSVKLFNMNSICAVPTGAGFFNGGFHHEITIAACDDHGFFQHEINMGRRAVQPVRTAISPQRRFC